ncbi:30S ribosomal protein S4 [Candidatus Woesearchaeota archaeon]|nr:MAG: 30S ribosomal protein S4 [Candidatus Woesearchaeota archaeon]
MGDPKKIRKKYTPPRHPWEGSRIEEEKVLMKEYGFKNKREIWKASSLLTNFKDQAKKLSAISGKQKDVEMQQLMQRLKSLALVKEDAVLDDVLSIPVTALLDRRLQTMLLKKGYARTVEQARQMIVHQHVMVGDKKITAPSYLVRAGEEASISFSTSSPFFSVDHPERIPAEKVPQVEEKAEEKSEDNKKGKKKEEKIEEPIIPEEELEEVI